MTDSEKLICPKCSEEFPATLGDRGPGPAKAKFQAHVRKCQSEHDKALITAACNIEEPVDPELMKDAVKATGAKKGTEFLKYYFTAAERSEASDAMAQAYLRLRVLEEELALIKAQYKSDTVKLDGEISDNARKLNSGYEMRNTDCYAFMDHDKKLVIVRRADTGEVVKVREMNTSELQRKLPLGEAEDGEQVYKIPADGKDGEATMLGATLGTDPKTPPPLHAVPGKETAHPELP